MATKKVGTEYGPINSAFGSSKLASLCFPNDGIQTGPFGSQLHAGDYVDIGTPIITVEHLGDNRISHSDVPRVSNTDQDRLSRFSLRVGDIVFSRVGSVDRRAIVGPEEEGWLLSGRCLRVCPDKSKVDARYLSYFFGWSSFRDHIRQIAVGATMPSLNTKILSDVRIFFPPLPEQRAIGAILGALDDKIELNRRMNLTLEEMVRALFKERFVDGAEDVWVVGSLVDFSELIVGGDWGKDQADATNSVSAYCIRGADIPSLQEGGVGKMPVRYLKPSSFEARRLRAGDIVIEISGGSPTQSTGRPVYISERLLDRLDLPLIYSNFCRLLRPKETLYSTYIYYWMLWLYSRDEFLQYENGTTGIKNFAFTIFADTYPINLPPIEVIHAYDKHVSGLLAKKQANGHESATLADLRDTLLPMLISGELRVGHVRGDPGESSL